MGEEPDRVAMVSDLRMETAAVRAEMAAMGARLEERIVEESAKLKSRIVEEGEATRRHFDIMVEDVKAAVKLVAEVTAHHAVVLDDHESRLKQVEKTQ